MTHPERQQDPFDSELPEQTITVRHEWKNLEALERRLVEIEGRLAVAECCIAVLTGQMTLEEANAELERLAAKRDQVSQGAK